MMRVRFMRHTDIPRLVDLIQKEVDQMPPVFGATVEAGMEFGHQHLQGGGFGLVVVNDDEVPVGCYIGQVLLMPAATKPIVADLFYSTSVDGAMDLIVNEVRHLAGMWECSGFTIGANGRSPHVLERWGKKWHLKFLSTTMWGDA